MPEKRQNIGFKARPKLHEFRDEIKDEYGLESDSAACRKIFEQAMRVPELEDEVAALENDIESLEDELAEKQEQLHVEREQRLEAEANAEKLEAELHRVEDERDRLSALLDRYQETSLELHRSEKSVTRRVVDWISGR